MCNDSARKIRGKNFAECSGNVHNAGLFCMGVVIIFVNGNSGGYEIFLGIFCLFVRDKW